MAGAKANEQEVCDLLNRFQGSEFEMMKNSRSVFDIKGFSEYNGIKYPTIVEVKERKQWWGKMWLEEDKFLSIFAKAKKFQGGEVKCFLVLSVKGEHLLYDLKDLWRYGTREEHQMNWQTADGMDHEGSKRKKKVISFKKDSYAVNLVTQELGPNYVVPTF